MTEILNNGRENTIVLNGNILAKIVPADEAEDSFEKIEKNAWLWHRHTSAPTDHMRMEILFAGNPTFTMIPSISYNKNGWGTTAEYVGDRCEGTPWTFASHRSTIPSCTYSENALGSLALMAQADDNSSCSLYHTEQGERHVVIFPEQEGPKTLQRHFWGDPFQGTMEQRCDFVAIILAYPSDGSKHRYSSLLDFAWRYYGHEIHCEYSPEELYRLSIAFSRYLYQHEKNGFSAFTMGAQWYPNMTAYMKTLNRYEISWVGQSASMANAFIWDYLQSGDTEKLDMGIAAHDGWLKFGSREAGHVAARVDYDPWRYMNFPADYKPDRYTMGECSYETHLGFAGKKFRHAPDGQILIQNDACNIGGAADGYFEAYDLLRKANIDKPEYLKAAIGICDFALRSQDENGGFAKSWDDDGKVLTKKGTIGCFLILPIITAYNKTGDKQYLEGAIRAFDFYYSSLETDGFTTAGALDTYCIDKESSSPLLRDALALYDVTKSEHYLRAAEKIAWYLCTWMMHFTVKYPKDSLLGKMGYDTFGSTSVSTAHQALDQYALRDVLSFEHLYELTGDIQWHERALAFWCNACQCISDGTQYINGRIRPAGAQDEAIFHTRWGRHGVKPFGPSQWLPAWPCAFRLENLRWHTDWSLFSKGLSKIEGKIPGALPRDPA